MIKHTSTQKNRRQTCGQHLNSQRGQAMLIVTVLFVAIGTTVVFGLSGPVVRQLKIETNLKQSHAAYYLSEALQEDIVYRIKNSIGVDDVETLAMNGHSAQATVTTVGNTREVEVEGDVNDRIRTTKTTLILDGGVAFAFGVQAGNGGFSIEDNARVVGNVYATGPIQGDGNTIEGNAIAAGDGNGADDIRTFGDLYADTITDSVVEGDAHYVTSISGTSVLGSSIQDPNTQPIEDFPLTDEQIEGWKDVAEAGAIDSCSGTKTINTDTTIGPTKYECDVVFKNNATITLTGHLWIEGNLEIQNNVIFQVDPSLGEESVVIIADKEANRTTSSSIILKNNSEYYGSGEDESFIMLLSMNESAELGGSEEAITVENNPIGDLIVYAAHGEIEIQNNVELKEVSAYLINIQNNAVVEYESGLASLLFDSGPGAGFNIENWEEIE